MIQKLVPLFCFISLMLSPAVYAQQSLPSSAIKQRIDKLNTLGTVLYFAAHPDDENTRLIAWLASEKNYRTAYLSLTRGDGGQNLIGTQQGVELGLIRTQELLSARKIDQGEQYFSAAYDFGFSKTHQETFTFWQKQEILKQAVFLIRKLQPDVIITRFPPDSRGGHGHHQASAILAKEAYLAAADPNKFPEQLEELSVWKAKRLVWNAANFGGMNNTSEDQLKIVLDDYNPLLGASYGEISALSRSQHRSQGFGSLSSRGEITEYFEHVAGDSAQYELLDDVNTSWSRLAEPTQDIQALVSQLIADFNPQQPSSSVKHLTDLHKLISKLNPSVYRSQKLQEVEDLIVLCGGIYLQSASSEAEVTENSPFTINQEVILRSSDLKVVLKSIDGQAVNKNLEPFTDLQIQTNRQISNSTQPYWLKKPHSLGKFEVEPENYGYPENPDKPASIFELEVNGVTFQVKRPIIYRYADPAKGEIHQPLVVSPALTAHFASAQTLLKSAEEEKTVSLEITNHSSQSQTAHLSLKNQNGLRVKIKDPILEIPANSSLKTELEIAQEPKTTLSSNQQTLELLINDKAAYDQHKIYYDHIPHITWFPATSLQVVNLDIKVPVEKIAYIKGAGDLIPNALNALGVDLEELNPAQLNPEQLSGFDAIILGVRSFNVLDDISGWYPTLLDYVKNGGTLLVQYNVNGLLKSDTYGPYPFDIGRERVTQEDAPVHILDPKDPALNYPNKITIEDFDGWIQERGLYFVENIDPHYRTLISIADDNQAQQKGSLIISPYGKGKFVYTSLSFFRQLPAGVPGAYRLFVNLLSKNEIN